MTQRKGRGFAGMDEAKKRQIASKGGKAAHQKGTAHEFTPEEARAAGRKGGQAAHQKGTAHRFTPEEARAAGRKGGQAAHRSKVSMPAEIPHEAPATMASLNQAENLPAPAPPNEVESTPSSGFSPFPTTEPVGSMS
jgi:general stress protein YciG